YPESSKLEVYIGAIASPPTRVTAATASEAAFSSTHVSGDDIITGIGAMTAGHGVWYRFKDRAGNISAWVQDGKVPAAPVISASAIAADLGGCDNTVDHINKDLKNAFNNFKLNIANTATGNEAGTIYMKLSDSAGTPNTYTTAGDAIAAAAAAANRGTFAAGAIDSFMNGNILIESWIKNAAGNASTWASVNKAGCLDTVLMDTLDLAALLGYSNAELKTRAISAIIYPENAKLQIYVGDPPPAHSSGILSSEAAYSSGAALGANILTVGSVQTAGEKIHYRLYDTAGNKTPWRQDGTVPAIIDIDKTAVRYSLADKNFRGHIISDIDLGANFAGRTITLYDNVITSPRGKITLDGTGKAFAATGKFDLDIAGYSSAFRPKYVCEDINDNRSDFAVDGTVPNIALLTLANLGIWYDTTGYRAKVTTNINLGAIFNSGAIKLYHIPAAAAHSAEGAVALDALGTVAAGTFFDSDISSYTTAFTPKYTIINSTANGANESPLSAQDGSVYTVSAAYTRDLVTLNGKIDRIAFTFSGNILDVSSIAANVTI
nr:hypothetical protein [Candidatus Wallbacteria bacterium]